MSNKLSRRIVLIQGSLSLLFMAQTMGCVSNDGKLDVDCCADIPAGAIPQPAGAKICQWNNAHVASALEDQTVLYRADFVGDTEQLSPGAIQRIARHVRSGLAENQSWIVAPSSDPVLDNLRVSSVFTQLAAHHVTGVTVELATPAALGLIGPQAERLLGRNGGNRSRGGGSRLGNSSQSGSGLGTSRLGSGRF